jgi:hypothetical protein
MSNESVEAAIKYANTLDCGERVNPLNFTSKKAKKLTLVEILSLVETNPNKLNKTELHKARSFLLKFGYMADVYLEAFNLDRRPGMIKKRLGDVCRLIRKIKEIRNEKMVQCKREQQD